MPYIGRPEVDEPEDGHPRLLRARRRRPRGHRNANQRDEGASFKWSNRIRFPAAASRIAGYGISRMLEMLVQVQPGLSPRAPQRTRAASVNSGNASLMAARALALPMLARSVTARTAMASCSGAQLHRVERLPWTQEIYDSILVEWWAGARSYCLSQTTLKAPDNPTTPPSLYPSAARSSIKRFGPHSPGDRTGHPPASP